MLSSDIRCSLQSWIWMCTFLWKEKIIIPAQNIIPHPQCICRKYSTSRTRPFASVSNFPASCHRRGSKRRPLCERTVANVVESRWDRCLDWTSWRASVWWSYPVEPGKDNYIVQQSIIIHFYNVNVNTNTLHFENQEIQRISFLDLEIYFFSTWKSFAQRLKKQS